MSSPSVQKFRRYILTASFAAITVTGAWYGAGLKMRQEYTQVNHSLRFSPLVTDMMQERKAVQEITTAQKIEQLEMTRSKLLEQRNEMQEKIDRLTAETRGDSQEPQQQAG